MKFKNELKNKKIVLKRTKPTKKMAELMFNTIDHNRDHLNPWFPWPQLTLTPKDSLKYLIDKEEKTKKGIKIEYGIYTNNQYIGNISLFDINQTNKSAEIGYWISALHTKKGYTTTALCILEKEAYNSLNLNRIQIKCDEDNKASAKVAKKCGYRYEGKLKQDNFNKYFNKFKNTLVFAKLKSEYKK